VLHDLDLGTNPFISPEELSDLLLASSIQSLRIGMTSGFFSSLGDLDNDVSGTVTPGPVPVSEPATIVLLRLAAIWSARARRSARGR
jgi:hypothetical protein